MGQHLNRKLLQMEIPVIQHSSRGLLNTIHHERNPSRHIRRRTKDEKACKNFSMDCNSRLMDYEIMILSGLHRRSVVMRDYESC
ncbi:hypothetical protein COOONC_03115 [Cooperia oncophora]